VQLLVDLTNEGAIEFYGARGYLETRMAARRRFIE
jgi:ribosomal protein S18 acetylase RimI-like enzyme